MNRSFGEILRETRERKGLSQSQLAQKAGFQPSAISHFEAGRREPSFDNLKRLGDALAVTIDYLIGRKEQPDMAGPTAEAVFRHFSELTDEDQQTLAELARSLANRNKQRQEGGRQGERKT